MWSAFTLAITAPSVDSLSALFEDYHFCPFFPKDFNSFFEISFSFCKRFLQSIIPAPVVFLSLATSAATGVYIIEIFVYLFGKFLDLQRYEISCKLKK